ncbi:Hypothetical protein NCS54_00910700 [Fusarium falciforme]|uniref:Hypothetical protein n=1 Tax=Fusarium falciforme TaxID=195108 RepID=UPI0023010B5B|nr:Hypothetical protein NCS54_00910700 [Fusarium falciforme]WAO91627.1 Hypothetical protein NCS54_00910700 [Fusarium falciforme]
MASFSNKVVAITGAASGIGLEIAKILITKGATLSISDIQDAALQSAASQLKELGGPDAKVLAQRVDVTKRSEVDAWIQRTVAEFADLHCAVNFAGVVDDQMGARNMSQQDDDDYNFVMNVNLLGVWNCMRAELSNMKSGASIVNASSAAGLIGFAGGAAYTASKHGVAGLTRSACKEFGSVNIRVNAVAPGYIITPMSNKASKSMGLGPDDMGPVKASALGRPGQPEEVAKLVVFLLGDDASYITGTVIPIDGGLIC